MCLIGLPHVRLSTDVRVTLTIVNISYAITLNCSICINSLNSQNSIIEVGTLTMLLLQRRKVRHREV